MVVMQRHLPFRVGATHQSERELWHWPAALWPPESRSGGGATGRTSERPQRSRTHVDSSWAVPRPLAGSKLLLFELTDSERIPAGPRNSDGSRFTVSAMPYEVMQSMSLLGPYLVLNFYVPGIEVTGLCEESLPARRSPLRVVALT